ncbi:MAG: 30S ribosomal protein S17e, partial [Candidatus Nanoarchaeia archaeon]
MGRIKTQLAKRIGQQVFDNHTEVLSTDFAMNKVVCAKIMSIPSKKLRNVVVG